MYVLLFKCCWSVLYSLSLPSSVFLFIFAASYKGTSKNVFSVTTFMLTENVRVGGGGGMAEYLTNECYPLLMLQLPGSIVLKRLHLGKKSGILVRFKKVRRLRKFFTIKVGLKKFADYRPSH